MTTAAYIQLPAKPSALIDLALDDLEWVEGNPKYRVDMYVYHDVDKDGVCQVCLAGAVMAHTLKAPIDIPLGPFQSRDPVSRNKLVALDWFRMGSVYRGLVSMSLRSSLPDRTIRNYHTDPSGFKADLRRLARDLAAEGL